MPILSKVRALETPLARPAPLYLDQGRPQEALKGRDPPAAPRDHGAQGTTLLCVGRRAEHTRPVAAHAAAPETSRRDEKCNLSENVKALELTLGCFLCHWAAHHSRLVDGEASSVELVVAAHAVTLSSECPLPNERRLPPAPRRRQDPAKGGKAAKDKKNKSKKDRTHKKDTSSSEG